MRTRGIGSIIWPRFVLNARRTIGWTVLRIKHKVPFFNSKNAQFLIKKRQKLICKADTLDWLNFILSTYRQRSQFYVEYSQIIHSYTFALHTIGNLRAKKLCHFIYAIQSFYYIKNIYNGVFLLIHCWFAMDSKIMSVWNGSLWRSSVSDWFLKVGCQTVVFSYR